MDALTVYVDGIGFWAPGLADWAALARAVAEDDFALPETPSRPSPGTLPPTERRRAPEPVLIASEAAGQAAAMAERDASKLACVFASTHGDLAITDEMCATLAAEPRELSPIRFHNSVHNAPAGYWTVAAHCHASATAISAERATFAAGLLEAALVLCPAKSERTLARLALRTAESATVSDEVPASLAPLRANPMGAQALPLLVALARRHACEIVLAAGRDTALAIEVTP